MRAAIAVAQRAFPALRDSGHGRIVFVVPTIASAGAAGFAAYCAVAEGLRGLTKSLAKQWGKHGITSNTLLVAPQLVVAGEVGQRLGDGVSLAVPALGTADPATDLAPVVALLASEDGHYATGSTLILDGGVWTVLCWACGRGRSPSSPAPARASGAASLSPSGRPAPRWPSSGAPPPSSSAPWGSWPTAAPTGWPSRATSPAGPTSRRPWPGWAPSSAASTCS
jgi:hypothetical protein